MPKRLRGGSSPTKEAKYKMHKDGARTQKRKLKKMERIIKGYKNPQNYVIKDMNIVKESK